jgi:D-glycero-alpha-D-manno-heptose-7-phosphate kinase
MTQTSDDHQEPAIRIARAPLRISLAGGGTDLASHARHNGGLVVSFAVNRYVAVSVFPRSFDGRVHARWEQDERVDDVAELANDFARAAFRRAGAVPAAQVASFTDAPSGTGLGGSAAFTVALLHALRPGTGAGPRELAEEASAVEMVDLGRPVGKHDHYMAAYGGIRALHIDRELTVEVEALPAGPGIRRYLRSNLLLFYTGISRDAAAVLTDQHRRTVRGEARTVSALRDIHDLGRQMARVIREDQVGEIGPMLHRHWELKRRLSPSVSTPHIADLIEGARAAGADGGKLLGGGGGGFLLVSVPDAAADRVRAAMARRGCAELTFDLDETGSRVATLPA